MNKYQRQIMHCNVGLINKPLSHRHLWEKILLNCLFPTEQAFLVHLILPTLTCKQNFYWKQLETSKTEPLLPKTAVKHLFYKILVR